MSINLANALKLSYNAGTQQLFSIAPIDNSLLTQRRVLFLASSTTIIPAKFMGQWDNAATYVATIYNPRTQFVVGGPAMVHINEDKICQVAVINTAPHEVCLEKRDFLGAVKALEQHLTALHPVETIPVGSLFLSATAGPPKCCDRQFSTTDTESHSGRAPVSCGRPPLAACWTARTQS